MEDNIKADIFINIQSLIQIINYVQNRTQYRKIPKPARKWPAYSLPKPAIFWPAWYLFFFFLNRIIFVLGDFY